MKAADFVAGLNPSNETLARALFAENVFARSKMNLETALVEAFGEIFSENDRLNPVDHSAAIALARPDYTHARDKFI